MNSTGTKWQAGDRVKVELPDKRGEFGPRNYSHWFTGIAREVDPPGLAVGVIVDLDQAVNGSTVCFAAHDELRAATAGEPTAEARTLPARNEHNTPGEH